MYRKHPALDYAQRRELPVASLDDDPCEAVAVDRVIESVAEELDENHKGYSEHTDNGGGLVHLGAIYVLLLLWLLLYCSYGGGRGKEGSEGEEGGGDLTRSMRQTLTSSSC